MKNKNLLALLDLDAMLHTIANVQFSAGNRDNASTTKAHVKRFINTINKNSGCEEVIMFYQKDGHTNYRNDILPDYKGHRTASDAILCWKPTILEAFDEEGAIGLQHIESDDAISIVADLLNHKVVIISSDKDMLQVPGKHYNPYKSNITAEERWKVSTYVSSNLFFWEQVLSGDATDMPNEFCGIPGVGPVKAKEALTTASENLSFGQVIQKIYTTKFGTEEGFKRANLTYKMVRLLKKFGNEYINKDAAEEVNYLITHHMTYCTKIENSIGSLFTPVVPDPLDLFIKKE